MRVLLLGAGFTRNWGGLLAGEFVGELCGRLRDRPHLNEMLRVQNNFEVTFGARRAVAVREPDNPQVAEDVRRLDGAILDTFRVMNNAVAERQLNFSQDATCSIRRFLSRFDAIYSLNQDLFFEIHYDHMELESDGRWHGYYFPGIRIDHKYRNPVAVIDRINLELRVLDEPTRERGLQPIYKLHGSSNWRSSDGNRVLVIGTGKEEAIAGNQLLRRYQDVLREQLTNGGTEVMVIGYGFSDDHINALLLQAARETELSLFLVHPRGTAAFDSHRKMAPNGRNELLEIPLAGISQRLLSETFADTHNPSFQTFERFFSTRR